MSLQFCQDNFLVTGDMLVIREKEIMIIWREVNKIAPDIIIGSETFVYQFNRRRPATRQADF